MLSGNISANTKISSLSSFIAEDPVLSHAFDTDVSLGKVEEMCRTLKGKQTPLSSELVAGIARLIASLGMEINTLPAIIAKLVCEVIYGWFVVLPVQSADAWLAEAAVFAHSFIDSQDCVVVGYEEKYFAAISEAFLAGARTSTKSWIAHIELNRDHAQDMIDRAVRVGLPSAEENFSRLSAPTRGTSNTRKTWQEQTTIRHYFDDRYNYRRLESLRGADFQPSQDKAKRDASPSYDRLSSSGVATAQDTLTISGGRPVAEKQTTNELEASKQATQSEKANSHLSD
ncbi:hypothetical protein KCU61_g110, partial [Aureobasidium melanogenum]